MSETIPGEHLCKNVAHLVTGLRVAGAQNLQQPQNLHISTFPVDDCPGHNS